MRPYRTIKLTEMPDIHDLKVEARKSSIGRLDDDESTYNRRSKLKRQLRRQMKRRDKQRERERWGSDD